MNETNKKKTNSTVQTTPKKEITNRVTPAKEPAGRVSLDFDTVCRDFFILPPTVFIAHIRDFLLSAFPSLEPSWTTGDSLDNTNSRGCETSDSRACAPILHPSEIAPSIAIIHAFEKQALAHPELYDNWLLFAIFNCHDCPREFLLPNAFVQDSPNADDAMTPLTHALLPAGSSIRAPHLARFKTQIEQYVQSHPAKKNK